MYKIVLENIAEQGKLDNIVKIVELLQDLYPNETLVDIVAKVFHLPVEIGCFNNREEAEQWRQRLERCGAAARVTASAPPVLVTKPSCRLS